MKLISEKIKDFRNIKNADFFPSTAVTVICGENGQGKTNLLESIFMLTGAKSFRHVKDRELPNKNSTGQSVLESVFFAEGRKQEIRITVGSKGRIASLNRGSERKASELAGKFCCVVFSPEHLDLVKGTPAERRRFIDTALCQISPGYLSDLREYTRLLAQKNALLKDARNIAAAFDMLEVYDERMAEKASSLASFRRKFSTELETGASEAYSSVSGDRESFSMRYLSTTGDDDDPEEILRMISAARSDDIRMGYCTIGPHRDDLEILLNGDPARVYGSQGQQRTAVLALKLAEAGIFRKKLGEEPVLLLDDVLSELDGSRQEFLLRRLGGSQAIITCCDPNFIERETDADVWQMTGGVLNKKE
ncbi:MAG: DNA replication/repair protein RecF [Oscillospiraceae bacterium]|nr:DNA replication/repair protein RecF [Oscillospiraceae bacterium]